MKNKETVGLANTGSQSDGDILLSDVVEIIESHKSRIYNAANAETVQMLWEVGRHVNVALLDNKRAEYGKQAVALLSQRLVEQFGATFNLTGLKRMRKFADIVDEASISATPWHQLSWSHIREILPLKNPEARDYYVQEVASRRLGVRDLRLMIERKTDHRGY